MRKPAGAAVIVPSPERGVLHLELHGPAQALACDDRAAREFPGFHRMRASLQSPAKVGSGSFASHIDNLTVETQSLRTFVSSPFGESSSMPHLS